MMNERNEEKKKTYDNEAFSADDDRTNQVDACKISIETASKEKSVILKERPKWSNKTEFLMSCIQTSVGLGNIWRFPFTAYENGGGAFLVPYVVVLFMIGGITFFNESVIRQRKPLYMLEMFLGQFTSQSSIKIWEINPAFRGIGAGQVIASICVITYYSSLVSLTVYYFFASFAMELPWAHCSPEWGANCVDSQSKFVQRINESIFESAENRSSSSEQYFIKIVLNQTFDISGGIGWPSWQLVLCLLGSWIIVFGIISRGVKSSGKASYFLAVFPYFIMITLLLRAVTLEGALKGILFFLTPQWHELSNPKIWYAAVNQAFFSLSLGSGTICMFSSYNKFNHKIYRDVLIVTTLDTVTSMIAGVTIFGILGNLAFNMGLDDISSVVESGTGLAFISYPDAISKFEFFPQAFAVLFFFMLFTLGIGSVVALQNVIVTVLCDQFPNLKYERIAAITSIIGFFLGLMYLTPGGQWMITLVDNFGGTLPIFVLGIFEIIGIFYFYGLEDLCNDIEFMTGRCVTFYWRICWILLAPLTMTIVYIYSTITMKPLTYANLDYPSEYLLAGWSIFWIAMLQLPLWFSWHIARTKSALSFSAKLKNCVQATKRWGPRDPNQRIEWLKFKEEKRQRSRAAAQASNHPEWLKKVLLAFGQY